MDLQKRANDLAAQASNKLSFLSGKIKISYNNSNMLPEYG